MGSIFRTADAAGVSKLYLCGITPTPFDIFGKPRAQLIKVSLGAEKTVAWEKAANTAKVIEKLKIEGFTIVAVEIAEGAMLYNEYRADPEKLALVLGHEVKGLPPKILKMADVVLKIPMRGKKESLNVGVAFGVVAFNLQIANY